MFTDESPKKGSKRGPIFFPPLSSRRSYRSSFGFLGWSRGGRDFLFQPCKKLEITAIICYEWLFLLGFVVVINILIIMSMFISMVINGYEWGYHSAHGIITGLKLVNGHNCFGVMTYIIPFCGLYPNSYTPNADDLLGLLHVGPCFFF